MAHVKQNRPKLNVQYSPTEHCLMKFTCSIGLGSNEFKKDTRDTII